MKRNKHKYDLFQLASAIVMIVALLWLTVSTPFVYASQQELAKQQKMAGGADNNLAGNEEEPGNSLNNTTEEKKPSSGNSFSEEYLHHHHMDDLFVSVIPQHYNCENTDVYTAFHGEVQVPPPNLG